MLGRLLIVAGPLMIAGLQPEWRPVDQGVDDVAPDRVSQRQVQVDQRAPSGFDRVYEIVGPDGKRSFVRVSGAVYALFDQSWYEDSGIAIVPPGTRFGIGTPPALTAASTERSPAPNAVSLRADGSIPRSPDRAPRSEAYSVGVPSIFGNELYRRVRITQLLHAAMKPETSSSQYAR
ncbi:MAG: hypothetical protein ACTS22_05595 [Phycisphaerales bacterium]